MTETTQMPPEPTASARTGSARTLRGTPVRDLLIGFLHLAALSSLGIAQPLLNLLGKYPAFFAAHDSTPVEVVAFALVLLLAPPLVLLLVEVVAALISPEARRVVHLVFIAGLAAVFALQIVRRFNSLGATGIFIVAILLGIAVALLYWRAEAMRSLLSILALAPVLFLFLFLFSDPVSKVITGGTAKAYALNGGQRPPIVMLVLDAFPMRTLEATDHSIDAKRYPTFAELAKDGVWYRNATTAHENTTYSVPSILDGRWPKKSWQPIVADHPNNLFTLLGRSYDENVQEVATNLCPPGLCHKTTKETFKGRMKLLGEDVSVVYEYLSLPKSMQNRLPPIGDKWKGFRQRDTAGTGNGRAPDEKSVIAELASGGRPAQLRQAIAAIRNTPRPQLNFSHVLLPHEPRQYLPDMRQYQSGGDPDPALDGPPSYNNQFLSNQSYQREMLQVGFTDRLVGELVRHLKQQQMYDKTMIVVVSDHGESFKRKSTPGGSFVPGKLTWRRAITPHNVEDIAPVVLFVKYPKGHGPTGTDSRWVKTIDILPTVAQELGIRLPFKVDGRSLLDKSYKGRSDVRVERSDGSSVVTPIPLLEQLKARLLSFQKSLFGTGSDSLYDIGPNPQLIGRKVSSLPVTSSEGLRATFFQAGAFKDLDPNAPVVPTHVKGNLIGGSPGGRDLAVALNGQIVAVGQSFAPLHTDAHKLNFAVLIPDSKLRRGPNRLEVFQVTGGGTGLERLGAIG